MTASLVSLPPLVAADGRFVPDVLLTVQQAAALCGCAEMTMRRRLRKNALPDAGQTQGHLQHLAEENRSLRNTVLELRRDVEFLRSLLNTGGAA